MTRQRLSILIALCAAFALAACGSSSSDKSSSASSAATAATAAPATKAPKVTIPNGPPPKTLVVKDLKKGNGPVAKPGSFITVNYVGEDYKTGKVFDSSYERGQPFPLQLGTGQVIPGWDKGIPGMRVGGRRELIIPPNLAYGPKGQPPTIGPNATLVFVIDLLSAK